MTEELNHIMGTIKGLLTHEVQIFLLGYVLGWAFKEWGMIVLVVVLLFAAGVIK
jgi:uncharacterized membrane protein (Fun14 family)